MSKGWRARLRRTRCLPFRAARACRVPTERRDDRQIGLFASAAPSKCEIGRPDIGLAEIRRAEIGCAGHVACETMQRAEAAAVKAALRELERAASDEPDGLRRAR